MRTRRQPLTQAYLIGFARDVLPIARQQPMGILDQVTCAPIPAQPIGFIWPTFEQKNGKRRVSSAHSFYSTHLLNVVKSDVDETPCSESIRYKDVGGSR